MQKVKHSKMKNTNYQMYKKIYILFVNWMIFQTVMVGYRNDSFLFAILIDWFPVENQSPFINKQSLSLEAWRLWNQSAMQISQMKCGQFLKYIINNLITKFPMADASWFIFFSIKLFGEFIENLLFRIKWAIFICEYCILSEMAPMGIVHKVKRGSISRKLYLWYKFPIYKTI